MIAFTAPLWLWNAERGSWHFITLPASQSAEVRLQSLARRGGFGSVRAEAAIGDVRWRTSLFPVKGGGEYILPVKADVRRRAGIASGDEVPVTVEVI